MTRALAIGCVIALVGCERAHDVPAPPPPRDARADARPLDARATPFKIAYAARTDDAPNGTNGTYFSIVEDDALFILADGTPEASKAAAELVADLFAHACPAGDDEAQLRCAFDRATTRLQHDHRTTSITAVTVRGSQALVARAGDTPVIWRHGNALDVFDRATAKLGEPSPPQFQTLDLQRGDTMFIVNKRMLEIVGTDSIRSAAPERESRKDVVAARVESLLAAGRHARGAKDALTAVAIHLFHQD
jgi:hypothetical protein